MKTRILLFSLLFVLALSAVSYAGQLNIINNVPGLTVYELHLSRASTNNWEEDVLGGDVLNYNEYVTINFHPAESECYWDMLAVDDYGNQASWYDIDLCSYSSITLNADGTATFQ